MKEKLGISILVAAFMMPVLAAAGPVTDEDFQVKTTRNLINLCTVSADDPHMKEAIHFCQGFLVGAYAYYSAENSGPEAEPLVCPPNPVPSRNDAIMNFIEWAKSHPEYMDEKPVETEFRFLTEKWPCKH